MTTTLNNSYLVKVSTQGGGGVKIAQNSVHVVCTQPLTLSGRASSFTYRVSYGVKLPRFPVAWEEQGWTLLNNYKCANFQQNSHGTWNFQISLTAENIKFHLIISFSFQNSECPLDLPTLPSLPPSNLTSNSLNSEVLMQIYSGALHLAAHFSYMAEDWNEGQECKSSKVTNTLIDAFNR